MNINEFLEKTRVERPNNDLLEIRKRVVCSDGYSISVQAGKYHYCLPRDNYGPYTYVEVGFPSSFDSLINEYVEGEEGEIDTVFPFVPVEIIDELIEKHGGFAPIPENLEFFVDF